MKKKLVQLILIYGLFAVSIAGCQQADMQNVDEAVSNEVQTESIEHPENNNIAGTADSEESTDSIEFSETADQTELPGDVETGYIVSELDATEWEGGHMSSVGEVCFPVFVVDFPDVIYGDLMVPRQTLEDWVYTGDDSVAGFYNTSSSGRLRMQGDIYYYTAKKSPEAYEEEADNSDWFLNDLDPLVAEIVEYFDDEVDFSKYNKDGDIFVDAFVIAVPYLEEKMDRQFWWPSYHPTSFNIADNTVITDFVLVQGPYDGYKEDFISSLKHELGHCLGLPDYYKPNNEDHSLSEDGMPGPAGVELMDTSDGEFSQFSKLQLGWLTQEQVQIMPDDADSETFLLPPAAEGGCLLIFPEGQTPDFHSEYLLVEYITPEGEWESSVEQGGVRILHVQAEVCDSLSLYGGTGFKYAPNSIYYDSSHNGIRMLKLVNGDDFYHTGDTVTFDNTAAEQGNFGWYDMDEESEFILDPPPATVSDPGFSIQIGDIRPDSGYIQVDVIRNP